MTTSRRRQPSNRVEAIDRTVVSQVDDPSVWEDPNFVPPSGSPRPAWMQAGKHLEFAAKFYVLSVLHRLGADANLTLAQPDDVDITVVRASGQALTVDVKTLARTTSWHVDQFRARRHHYIVFVSFLDPVQEPDQPPRVVIVNSQQLERVVRKHAAQAISIDDLSAQIGVSHPWEQLVSDPAA